jgi:hypothetical protein
LHGLRYSQVGCRHALKSIAVAEAFALLALIIVVAEIAALVCISALPTDQTGWIFAIALNFTVAAVDAGVQDSAALVARVRRIDIGIG